MEKINNTRIEWVDIAKGIAIILMVIGHEIPTGQMGYRFIFSFHMPLFLILSGFTSGAITSNKKFFVKLKNSFKKVWLLAVIVVFIYCLECLLFQPTFDLNTFVKQFILGIFWGCNKIPITNVTGTMWFMFAFFWSKLLYDLLQLWLPNVYNGIILLILASISFLFHKWLPQVIDLAPYGALFMWMGWLMRYKMPEFNQKVNKTNGVILGFIATYWIALVIVGIYVDMSIRKFPLFIVSILEAFAGTILICKLSSFGENKISTNWLKVIGRYTLPILCIHQLDLYWVIWSKYFSQWYLAVIMRLIVDMAIFLVYLYLYRCFIINKSKD